MSDDKRARSQRIASFLENNLPEVAWTVEICESGELEMFVEAPERSAAGALVVITNDDELWARFAPPQLFYSIKDEAELLYIVRGLLSGDLAFKRTSDPTGSWLGTTLVNRLEVERTALSEHESLVSW